MRAKKRNIKAWVLVILGLIILLPLATVLYFRMEGIKPEAELAAATSALGVSQEITLLLQDQQSGLRKVRVELLKDDQTVQLKAKDYPAINFIRGGQIHQDELKFRVEPKKAGLADGKALLRIAVWDYAWRSWFKGNLAYLEKEVAIDTQPPRIRVLSKAHNLNQGGSGLVIYQLSEQCSQSGVAVDDKLFPGHPGYFKDPNVYLAYFALDHNQGPGTQLAVSAIDLAGNNGRAGFYHHINGKQFRKDRINLSDNFLEWKMPEFEGEVQIEPGADDLQKFLAVNRNLRKKNYEEFVKLAAQTNGQMLWRGVFGRLPNSAPRAGYADHRSYLYKGQVVDHQVHLGVDLASTANSPVPAANNGKIVFTGRIGIYGNTVVLDHGFGLFSIYSHLNSIQVTNGQSVNKDDVLGQTGMTGLAGGDHLHFGIMVHNTFVNPIEWWDPNWIQHNVIDKLQTVKGKAGSS